MKLVPCIKCGKKFEMPDSYFGNIFCEACEDEKYNLIAVAPDLLEACKWAKSIISALGDAEEIYGEPYINLCNSINKAEGNSETIIQP